MTAKTIKRSNQVYLNYRTSSKPDSLAKKHITSIDEEELATENLSVEVDSLPNDLSNNEEGPDTEVKKDVFSNPFR